MDNNCLGRAAARTFAAVAQHYFDNVSCSAVKGSREDTITVQLGYRDLLHDSITSPWKSL